LAVITEPGEATVCGRIEGRWYPARPRTRAAEPNARERRSAASPGRCTRHRVSEQRRSPNPPDLQATPVLHPAALPVARRQRPHARRPLPTTAAPATSCARCAAGATSTSSRRAATTAATSSTALAGFCCRAGAEARVVCRPMTGAHPAMSARACEVLRGPDPPTLRCVVL
jgi:hypothetical protein